jgi:glycosyltransferase involved in cell wall biosynthesis
MGQLGVGLRKRGALPTVLTTQSATEWPERMEHHGVPVIRLRAGASGRWTAWQTAWRVYRWLRQRRAEIDLVCVSGLRQEAWAALAAAGGRYPVVLRSEGAGLSGDIHWQLDAWFGARIKRRCLSAAALVAPNPACHRELLAAGFLPDRCHYIPCGTAAPPLRTAAARLAARQVLGRTHPAMGLAAGDPLALYAGRLAPSKGLDTLVAAWHTVLMRRPAARLWIAGEGPESPRLADEVRRRGIAASVVLTGAFDRVEDLLAAAELFIAPAREEGTSLAVLEAMAAGLPVAATDIPGHRALVEPEVHGLVFAADDPAGLAAAVLRLMEQPGEAERMGTAARQRALGDFPLEQMIERHAALFEGLCARAAL